MHRSLVAALLLVFSAVPGKADSCSSVVAGAQMGPSPTFNGWPWKNACYISWPGGYIDGLNARFHYEPKCKQVPGFLHFEGDRGSNRNTCIFSAPSTASPPSNDDEALRKSVQRLRQSEADIDADYRNKVRDFLAKIRDMGARQNQYYDYLDWQRVYDASDDIQIESDTFLTFSPIKPDMTAEVERQTCIKQLAFSLNIPNTNSPVPSECAAHRNDSLVNKMLARKQREDKLKVSEPGDWFGVIIFARNTSFFGTSVNKKTLEEAYQEAVANCVAMARNTNSTGYDASTRCDKFQWISNTCLSTALTDDDRAYVASKSSNDVPSGLQQALDICRTQTSSTVCRPGPRICSKGPNR